MTNICIFLQKYLVNSKKSSNFAPAFRKKHLLKDRESNFLPL